MTRRPIIAGNWKMNLSISDALELASAIRHRCGRFRDIDVVISPQAMALWPIAQRLEDSTIGLAAQNCHWAEKGAYTGELSPIQLKEVGCTHVIIGHSERRQHFGETDQGVAQKVRALHDHDITPIMCVGESLAQREAGQTLQIVSNQIIEGLSKLSPEEIEVTVIAYEPIWAIGTGRTATPEQAQEVHAHIRRLLTEHFGSAISQHVRIQYGGSVKPGNIRDLMAQEDIDGALVGGASLTAESFGHIVAFKEDASA
ncbi:MAG: triose-phosphate isomerase [Myxococcota bacterium]|nr:triose-phosphate isomerase [Myxococcota bacterium]